MTDFVLRPFRFSDPMGFTPRASQSDWRDMNFGLMSMLLNKGQMWTGELHGRVCGFGGAIPKDGWLFLLIISDDLAARPLTLTRAVDGWMQTVRHLTNVWTHTAIGNGTEARWVSRLGFKWIRRLDTAHLWELP